MNVRPKDPQVAARKEKREQWEFPAFPQAGKIQSGSLKRGETRLETREFWVNPIRSHPQIHQKEVRNAVNCRPEFRGSDEGDASAASPENVITLSHFL